MTKIPKKTKYFIVPILIASLLIGTTVLADEADRKSMLHSIGAIHFSNDEGSILIDSADLVTLADEIDTLESVYKSTTLSALNDINIYIKDDGTITHQQPENQISMPTFSQLAEAIIKSQSSTAGITELSGTDYYKSSDGSLIKTLSIGRNANSAASVDLVAATSDNLSAGTVAYIDGSLLLGTGADNNAYYNLGYADGYAEKMGGTSIEYVYHKHEGSQATGGGCYVKDSTSAPSGYVLNCGMTEKTIIGAIITFK